MFPNVEKSYHNLKYTFYVIVSYTCLLTLVSLLDTAVRKESSNVQLVLGVWFLTVHHGC